MGFSHLNSFAYFKERNLPRLRMHSWLDQSNLRRLLFLRLLSQQIGDNWSQSYSWRKADRGGGFMEDICDASSARGVGHISHFDTYFGEQSSNINAISHQSITKRVWDDRKRDGSSEVSYTILGKKFLEEWIKVEWIWSSIGYFTWGFTLLPDLSDLNMPYSKPYFWVTSSRSSSFFWFRSPNLMLTFFTYRKRKTWKWYTHLLFALDFAMRACLEVE